MKYLHIFLDEDRAAALGPFTNHGGPVLSFASTTQTLTHDFKNMLTLRLKHTLTLVVQVCLIITNESETLKFNNSSAISNVFQ